MIDSFATARSAVAAASAISPRLGGSVALTAFFSTRGRMPVRTDDLDTHRSARRGSVRVGGLDLVTYRWGGGDDTVLLVHGWRGRASQFAPLVRELVSAGFHVVSFDAPAHGDSPGWHTDIRDWLAAIEQLQVMHGRFRAIVGHSFGGLAALTAARQGITTASVAAVSSAGTATAFLDEFGDAMRLGDRTRERFAADFRRRLGEDEASLARRYDAIANPLPAGVDLLVVHDDTDRQLSPNWSLALFEAHRDRARLVRTSGFGHARILTADPVLDAVIGLATGGLAGVDQCHGVAIEPRARGGPAGPDADGAGTRGPIGVGHDRGMTQPALLAISHGTASQAGQAAIRRLVDAVAARLPGVTVRLGHVDVQQPDVAASIDALPVDEQIVIVPLLLSAGYHVRVDLLHQSAGRDTVAIAPALGPDPRLVDVLVTRLAGLDVQDADSVVLAVAGSSDERANDDCRTIGRMLAERLSREVTVGFLAAADPQLGDLVTRASASRRRVVVANYLLAPGYFHDLAVRVSGDAPVARPLLDDDEPAASLVDLVLDRYHAAVSHH